LSGRCPDCGRSWDETRRGGRLGCCGCWSAFRGELVELLSESQGSDLHPDTDPSEEARRLVRTRLDARLQEALAREDYAEAGRLRDLLKDEP